MQTVPDNNFYKLIHDPLFFEWVARPTKELDAYWKEYLNSRPEEKTDIDEARVVIKGLLKKQAPVLPDEIGQIWETIQNTIYKEEKHKIRYRWWLAAAGIVLIAGFAGLMANYQNIFSKENVDYKALAVTRAPEKEVTLILSDQTSESFQSADVELIYNGNGQINTPKGEVIKKEVKEKDAAQEEYNQLIVPNGKRSNITLSDGSKLWLNSGSRAIYPVIFNKKTREIYIEGEAYIEVTHNPGQPFYVVTDQINVKVLGTKFNICAYPDDNNASVALAEGSIEASVKSEKYKIEPNELFSFGKQTGEINIEKVDIAGYISWKEGWLYCNKEKLGKIIPKLSRYYSIRIECANPGIKEMTLTGKLDLKNECTGVLNTICTTAPLEYSLSGEVLYLSEKK